MGRSEASTSRQLPKIILPDVGSGSRARFSPGFRCSLCRDPLHPPAERKVDQIADGRTKEELIKQMREVGTRRFGFYVLSGSRVRKRRKTQGENFSRLKLQSWCESFGKDVPGETAGHPAPNGPGRSFTPLYVSRAGAFYCRGCTSLNGLRPVGIADREHKLSPHPKWRT